MENENRSYRERAEEFLREKGVYLVLLVCIGVVGIAAAAAYLPPAQEEEQPMAAQQPQQAPATPEPAPLMLEQVSATGDETLAEAAAATPEPEPTPENTPAPEPQQPAATPRPARDKADPPLKGGVQRRYALEELIYSPTLDQWMTHSGVDISAARGAEVRAVWSGVVEEVYEDDSLGVSVRISHGDGLETVYANLEAQPPCKEGQRVAAGEVIGHVGNTAVSECAEGAHLHFEVHQQGKALNPMDYIVAVEG